MINENMRCSLCNSAHFIVIKRIELGEKEVRRVCIRGCENDLKRITELEK